MPNSLLETLDPPFGVRVANLIVELNNTTGYNWVITSGRRTMKEQRDLYEQGRTKPGKVVTKAPPGYSPHNFGLAADLAPMSQHGNTIWWEAPRSVWKQMADLAVEKGFVAGFYFKSIFDGPHIEDANWKDVQKAWIKGELKVA